MAQVVHIHRYPIKGLSPERLERVEISAGGPLPFDRVFALARPGAPIDPDEPRWAKKGLFLESMLDDGLSEVSTRIDPTHPRLSIARAGQPILEADLAEPAGRQCVEAFFRDHVPGLDGPPRLVRSKDAHFSDKPENLISLINLATLRNLEARWGFALDPLRFRANLYVDGIEAWREFDWVGAEVRIGNVKFRVDRRNGRCGATNVNPVSGKRDLDIPGSLRRDLGHKDLGVYLVALDTGPIYPGDLVDAPDLAVVTRENARAPEMSASRRFICRGCYFIYDEAMGSAGQHIAPGTTFPDLPADYKCPDCGTHKGNLRPYRAHGDAPI